MRHTELQLVKLAKRLDVPLTVVRPAHGKTRYVFRMFDGHRVDKIGVAEAMEFLEAISKRKREDQE